MGSWCRLRETGGRQHAIGLKLKRHPEYAAMVLPALDSIVPLRIVPEVVSVLDYSKGFGHADLVRLGPESTSVV